MKYQPILTNFLWLIPMCLQACIAVAMLVRSQNRTFPVFFCYTVFVPLRDLILFLVRGETNLYSLIYWIGEAVTIILGIGLLCEIVRHLTSPYPFLRSIGLRMFWFTVLVTCSIGVAIVITTCARERKVTIELFLLVEVVARGIQAAVLIIFVALVSLFDLKWRHHTAGIIAGLGIAAGLQLGLYQMKSHLHAMSDATFSLLAPAGYNVAVIIWALYFLPAHQETKAETVPTVDLSRVDRMLGEFRAR